MNSVNSGKLRQGCEECLTALRDVFSLPVVRVRMALMYLMFSSNSRGADCEAWGSLRPHNCRLGPVQPSFPPSYVALSLALVSGDPTLVDGCRLHAHEGSFFYLSIVSGTFFLFFLFPFSWSSWQRVRSITDSSFLHTKWEDNSQSWAQASILAPSHPPPLSCLPTRDFFSTMAEIDHGAISHETHSHHQGGCPPYESRVFRSQCYKTGHTAMDDEMLEVEGFSGYMHVR